jgi:serine-type D-Ala-D-Ala carboxypeptidase/endopeptidase (penicillin-binding protein 4)
MTAFRFFFYFAILVFFASCSPAKRLGLKKAFENGNSQHHSGFMLYDLEESKTVYEFNSEKYFTPASNTKIFTFYTALKILGDSVPGLKYLLRNDSLIFWGTGDPSFLYKYTFNSDRVYQFLKSSDASLYFSSSNFFSDHFGPGWAWDDYNSIYSSERSPLPLYGNFITVKRNGKIFEVHPPYFDKHFSIGDGLTRESVIREPHSNVIRYHSGTNRTKNPPEWEIPMRLDQQVVADLLSDTLNRKVTKVTTPQPPAVNILYSIPTDSLYRVMMQDSDNFIAEQLLLLCSDVVRDTLRTETAIKYSIRQFLNDLPDEPIWVDGSGLSRYNLFTPRSIVKLWEKIYKEVPRERLFPLLATGGKNGTIRNWYKAESPYIFGKTGTLSNNHALSGYLVTKSGKTLIFSFMNNSYVTPINDIRNNMQKILYNIYLNY